MARQRLTEIDVATGIAMILVIAGHLGWKETDWYLDFKTTLYLFHMPFFMFLSGFLLAYTNYHYTTVEAFKSFIKTKALKFFIPYLFFYVLFIGVDVFLENITNKEDMIYAIKAMFLFPKSGSAGYLWYVYLLIEYYIFFPLLFQLKFIRNNTWIFLIVGILTQLFMPYYKFLEVRNFAEYIVFFSLGFVFQNHYDVLMKYEKKIGFIFLLIFLIAFILDITQIYTFSLFVLGLLSLPALLFLSLLLSKSGILQYLGQSSFTLYLWNSVFIFATKFICSSLGYSNFNILFPLYFFVGVTGPLLLKHFTKSYRKSYFIRAIIP